jgi:Transposase DDE domain group 1
LEPAALYEKFYCAWGDMENRIKEQQLDLFSDRISTHWMASNQLRLWFSAFAHLIMSRLQAKLKF